MVIIILLFNYLFIVNIDSYSAGIPMLSDTGKDSVTVLGKTVSLSSSHSLYFFRLRISDVSSSCCSLVRLYVRTSLAQFSTWLFDDGPWSMICPRYSTDRSPNWHLNFFKVSPTDSNLPNTVLRVSRLSLSSDPVTRILSKYIATLGISANRLSRVLSNIAEADDIPNGSRLYWKGPLWVLIVVRGLESSSNTIYW